MSFDAHFFWVFPVLGIMVLVHEFGHFAAAKLFGVRVEQFAIGFGKRLWGIRRGGTDYRINLLPFGGYVKMSGENPLDNRSGDPAEFMSHPRWQRFVIAIAGPTMNVLLAVGLLTGVFMVQYVHPAYIDQPVVVGGVQANSPAAQSGIQPGDKIIRLGGKQNPTWEDAAYEIAFSPNQTLDVELQRGNEVMLKKLTPVATGRDEIGSAGISPDRKCVVVSVEQGMPAAKAGIQVGDEILAVNGKKLHSPEELIDQIQQAKQTATQVTLLRNGAEQNVTVTPTLGQGSGDPHYRIGVGTNEAVHVDPLPFPSALRKSLQENKRNSVLIIELLEKMIQNRNLLKQMAGPLGIAQATGQAAKEKGWTPLLQMTSLISLNLGVFNLFPIPILDGGVILLLLVESVMRRDISVQVKERIYQAAFVFLVLFAAVVIYNDLAKMVPGMGRP
jgi:regulator of sigma E protease